MKIWMDVMRDIEHLIDDHERILDGWQEGGVEGLVIGPTVFNSPKLQVGTLHYESREKQPVAIFDPNPKVYARFGVEPPEAPADKEPEKRVKLDKMLTSAKDRGFTTMFFGGHAGGGPGGDGHHLFDKTSCAASCARIVDTLEAFPMVDGTVFDGPEWGYEIAPHHQDHRSYIFRDLPDNLRDGCTALGYDFDALVAAKDRLFDLFHNLDPRRIHLHGGGGYLGGFHLLGADPDLAAWMKFRVDSITGYFRGIREGVDAVSDRKLLIGAGPRSASWAPLTGCDFAHLADHLDIMLPKHYFFHRGFDGFLGTVFRYVETLCEWNPKLTDADAFEVVQAFLGIRLPAVEHRRDLEHALTPEFYREIVGQETRRAVAVVDDPSRIVPWLDTGRAPHDGDPMTAHDLHQLLTAAQEQGLQRFLYHHHGNLTAGEWGVMSGMCGKEWEPRTSAYAPPDEAVL